MTEEEKQKYICEWKLDEDGVYFSSCGYPFISISPTTYNCFIYCPYCGDIILKEKIVSNKID